MKVQGKRIIVTGAGAGIGKELAIQLIKKGAFVVGLDINELNLHVLKEEINSSNLSTYVVDVSNDESLNKFKEDYYKEFSDVDGIINNAGIIQPFINIDAIDMDTVYRVMNVNFFGPLKLTKLFLPNLLTREAAHIVNVSSMGGFFPFPGQTIYGASKAALKMLTEGLYGELMDTNVKVTVVLPGAINTNIAANSNVTMKATEGTSNYKMTSASDAASIIIKAMEKDKFKVYVGSDSKAMNLMYKFNDAKAIKFVNKKMKDLVK